MKALPKVVAANTTGQATRAHYTWHLRPPFDVEFDNRHWWANETQIEPAAALYELARRHPHIGQVWLKFKKSIWYGCDISGRHDKKLADQAFIDLGQEPGAVHCLCLIGQKSWPKLHWKEKDFWLATAGKMKGLDCRTDSERCSSIQGQAQADIIMKRAHSLELKKGALQFHVAADRSNPMVKPVNSKAFKSGMNTLIKDLKKKPIPTEEMEAAVARHAIAAQRNGHLLFSLAPDLTMDDAVALFESAYNQEQKLAPAVKQRARPEDWPRLIAEFEDEEANPAGKRSQIFVRYRRALDAVHFVPKPV